MDCRSQRLDMDCRSQRLDMNSISQRLDIDCISKRLDMDCPSQRLDINCISQRLDMDYSQPFNPGHQCLRMTTLSESLPEASSIDTKAGQLSLENVAEADINTGTARPGPVDVDIDPDGDLLIDATQNPTSHSRFRVCSSTLRRHSPVWKSMLFGPWKEARPTDGTPWIVAFPDDHAHPLEVLLSIIHGKFERVPRRPTVNSIHQILVLAHKYDLTAVASPWCLKWLKPASRLDLPAADLVRSLYIAWELGDEHIFTWRLEQLALQSRIDKEGRLVYGDDIVLEDEDHLGPHDVLGKMTWSITMTPTLHLD